jgi:hypothetical protein
MAFFNKLNTVARTAAKTAADMASDAIGTGRIAVRIKREESVIDAQYEKIGEYIYKMRNQGAEIAPEIEECCVAIDIALATIKELREELKELRENGEITILDDVPEVEAENIQRICPECGANVPGELQFCADCGTKPIEE